MPEDLQALVTHDSWSWLPGMKAVGRRSLPEAWFRLEGEVRRLHGEWALALPDFSDAATLGCLQELVRRKYRDPNRLWGGRVEVHQDHRMIFGVVQPFHCEKGFLNYAVLASGETEASALCNALCADVQAYQS